MHDNEQSFTIPNAKAGADIVLPYSEEIASVLRMARDMAREGAELVFPGLSYIDYRDAGLPVKGKRCATRTGRFALIWKSTN